MSATPGSMPSPDDGAGAGDAEPTIAIAVITHSRVDLLRKCVENVLSRTSTATTEIVIWNNASTDGTRIFLDSLTDPRVRVVHHPENIGVNAYARAFQQTRADYLIDLDDDVVGAPDEWDRMLLDAYRRLPEVGFLAADLAEDEHDEASLIRHRHRPDQYVEFEQAGIRLLDGPTGGCCAITDRVLHDRVGGFPQSREHIFFLEDAEYIERIEALGYRKAVLADLRVHHTGGAYYGPVAQAKTDYWRDYVRDVRRRNAIKRVLLAVPFMRRLNGRYEWFGPLEEEVDLG
jgi:rhamnopyranosyl-N-acetylglucosaminyl-diphospho-decaprenol beta-1,3/1,4-galactofuranosyltransferase